MPIVWRRSICIEPFLRNFERRLKVFPRCNCSNARPKLFIRSLKKKQASQANQANEATRSWLMLLFARSLMFSDGASNRLMRNRIELMLSHFDTEINLRAFCQLVQIEVWNSSLLKDEKMLINCSDIYSSIFHIFFTCPLKGKVILITS